VNSHADRDFWKLFHALPPDVRRQVRKAFDLFQDDPFNPKLRFKELKGHKGYWEVSINRDVRGIGRRVGNNIDWFWIGDHEAADKIIDRLR
jgi:hypothetical protein